MLKKKIDNDIIKNPYIIEIDARLLLDPNARFIFCEGNAASYSKNRGPAFKDFMRMFQNDYPLDICSASGFLYSRTRTDLNRKLNETTDEQAEILVERIIPKKYFIRIYNVLTREIIWQRENVF